MEEERIKTGKEYSSEDVELTVGEIIRKLYSDMAAGMVIYYIFLYMYIQITKIKIYLFIKN